MAHERKRHLQSLLDRTIKFSPITGILGHRQVGKATLASRLGSAYVTMDVTEDLSQALVNPSGFLSSHLGSPLTIDECQLAAPLFPALKEWVRTRKKPGQFLLTGSVRFTSRKAIRESLNGRIVSWELLPMDWSEQHSRTLPDSIVRALDSKNFNFNLEPCKQFNIKAYQSALEFGGLPGVFAVRDPSIRAQRFETQLNTILERDLKLLIQTTLEYRVLRSLLVSLSRRSGQLLNLAEISRETRITLPTLRKLMSAFEALFLIRFIATEGDFRKPILFFEDLGECNYVRGNIELKTSQMLLFLYQNLRVQFHYRPELKIEIFNFQGRGGHNIPLCFRKSKNVLGIIPLEKITELTRAQQDAEFFTNRYPGSKVFIVTLDDQDQLLSPLIRLIGAGRLI